MNIKASSPAFQAHTAANFHVGSLDVPSPFPATAIEAAELYIAQGVTVFSLHPPGTGPGKQDGKVPAVKGYRQLRSDWCGEAEKQRYWGATPAHNMAIHLPPGHVAVDLDSKADEGSSVGQWLEAQASLPATLQVMSMGGRHLYFRCQNLPVLTKPQGMPRAPTLYRRINDDASGKLIMPEILIRAPLTRLSTGYL